MQHLQLCNCNISIPWALDMGNIQRRKIKSRVSTRSRCENSFVYFHSTECSLTGLPQGGPSLWNQYISSPKGVLRISSYGGDRRIFLGLEICVSGIFWGRKFWQVFLGVAWFEKECFGGIQNNRKIRSAASVSRSYSSSNKVQSNLVLKTWFFVLYHYMLSGNFQGSEIRFGMGFFVGEF